MQAPFPLLQEELSRADARRALLIRGLAVHPELHAAALDSPFRAQLLLGSLQALSPPEALLAGPYFWSHLQSAYAALAAGRRAELEACLDRLALAALDSFAHSPAFRWTGRLPAPGFLEFHALRLGVVGRRGVALREMYWASTGLHMVFEDDGEFEISLPPPGPAGPQRPRGLRLTGLDPSEFDIGDNAAQLEDEPGELGRFREQLSRAQEMLAALSPPLSGLVHEEAWYVVPLRKADRHVSFSLSRLPRTVFIGGSGTLWPVTEALVHEVAHLRLNRAAEGLAFAPGPRQPVCYSPWRDDPRPVDGLVHGAYSFSLVLDFWLQALEAGGAASGGAASGGAASGGAAWAGERVALLAVQLADAHEVLARCPLSDFGRSLVARLRASLPSVGELPAGRASIERARAAAERHRHQSRAAFPDLIAPASVAGQA